MINLAIVDIGSGFNILQQWNSIKFQIIYLISLESIICSDYLLYYILLFRNKGIIYTVVEIDLRKCKNLCFRMYENNSQLCLWIMNDGNIEIPGDYPLIFLGH